MQLRNQKAPPLKRRQKLTNLSNKFRRLWTDGQLSAIDEMKITQETAMTIMQEQGVSMGGPQGGRQGGRQGVGNSR